MARLSQIDAGTDNRDAPDAAQRREQIQVLVLTAQEVTVAELVERFAVSVMTVHRDLDALEGRGVLRKVRGGATAQPTGFYESSLAYRIGEQAEAKQAIAAAAARHVVSGSSIALDDSTTALAMVPHLAQIPHLTVITNFPSVVEEMRQTEAEEVEVVLVGGSFSAKYGSFSGALTERWLGDFRVDQCFLSVSAVDVERGGAFHREADHASLKRAMVAIARESFLLVDNSKFAREAIHAIVDFDAFDTVIVDAAVPAQACTQVRAHGTEVEVADE